MNHQKNIKVWDAIELKLKDTQANDFVFWRFYINRQ